MLLKIHFIAYFINGKEIQKYSADIIYLIIVIQKIILYI
mgnify:CR=1 FL=1